MIVNERDIPLNTLVVATANLLTPVDVRQAVAPQIDRLQSIVYDLNEMQRPSDARFGWRALDILFVSELEMPNLGYLCSELGMVAVVSCEQDDVPEANALLVSPALAERVETPKVVTIGSVNHSRKALYANIGGIGVIGEHDAWEPFAERSRYKATQDSLMLLADYDTEIILGDFNSPLGFPSRRLFPKSGFYSVAAYSEGPTTFPNPDYMDISVPWYAQPFYKMFKMNLDDIYSTMQITSALSTYSATDHPLLRARLVLPSGFNYCKSYLGESDASVL